MLSGRIFQDSSFSVLPEAKDSSIWQGETMCFKEHFQIWGGNITLKIFGEYEQGEEDGKEKFSFYDLRPSSGNQLYSEILIDLELKYYI